MFSSTTAVMARLGRFRRQWKWRHRQPWWILWVASLPLLVFVFLIAEHFGDHEFATRQTLQNSALWTLLIWLLIGAAPLVFDFLIQSGKPGLFEMARLAGRGNENLGNRLLDALQMRESARDPKRGFDDSLVEAAFQQAETEFAQTDLERALPTEPRKRAFRWATMFAVGMLVVLALGGASSQLAARRLVYPTVDFRSSPTHFLHMSLIAQEMEHVPEGLEVLLEGQQLDLQIQLLPIDSIDQHRSDDGVTSATFVPSRLPTRLLLHVEDQNGQRSYHLPITRGRAILTDVQPATFIRAFAEGQETNLDRSRTLRSDTLYQCIFKLPALDQYSVRWDPPSYTGLPARVLPEGEIQVRCPLGSRIFLEAKASGTLSSATLCFLPRDDSGAASQKRIASRGEVGSSEKSRVLRWPLTLRDDAQTTQFDARIVAKRPGRWWLELLSEEGLPGRSLSHHLTVVPDRMPRLKVLAPASPEGALDRSQKLQLALLAEDDYGFKGLTIVFRRLSPMMRDAFEMPELSTIEKAPPGWENRDLPLRDLAPGRAVHESDWSLHDLQLMPDDEVLFFFLLRDNDGIHGPKTVRSALFRYKMPGLKELFAESEKSQEELAQEAEELLEETRENQKELKQVSEELKRGEELNWQRRQKLKQIAKKQEMLAERSEEMLQKLEDLEQQMESNQLVSDELQKKMGRLKELLQKAMDPELLEKLKNLAAQKPEKPGEAKKQVADMQELMRQLEQQLDRFLQVLEQMQVEQRLEELAHRAQELLEKQRASQEAGEKSDQKKSDQQKADQQKDLAEQAKSLEDDIDKTVDEFSDRDEFPQKTMEQIQQNLKKNPMSSRMQKMSSQMQQGNSPPQDQQEQLDLDMNQLAEDLQQALEESRQQAMDEMAHKIDRICLQLLMLSQSQESQTAELKSMGRSSARLPNLALRCQDNRLGLASCANEVDALIRQSFHIPRSVLGTLGTGLLRLDEMLENYHERRPGKLTRLSPEAMGRMNMAILQLKEAKQKMQQSQSASGFEEMMRKLAQASSKQQCLNGQCNKLMCAKPGQSQKPLSISFGGAKMEQEGIRESLQGMNEKLGDDGRPQLGDMGKVASDMREVEKDLASRSFTERTKRLQERILTRLLDAQRSLRRQDESKKRESRQAEALPALNPDTQKQLEANDDLTRALLEAMRVGWTPESEELIRAYFRALDAQEPLQAIPVPLP